MKIIKASGPTFERAMAKLDDRLNGGSSAIGDTVSAIIAEVRRRGDAALVAFSKRFDGSNVTPTSLRVLEKEMGNATRVANPAVVKALNAAAKRIKSFHQKQVEKSWSVNEKGCVTGQVITPLESVGVYVPGGKACYPSSVLMNVIPARIAGVKRVVMVTPAPRGYLNPHVLVAAGIAGVDEVWKIGGAQAVAALAYGTKSIKPVDKIVGPGNAYVAEAKRQVFGKVDIDMIAGPSEILALADDTANPVLVAADLLSQAEHDENAYPILVTTSEKLAKTVDNELKKQAARLDRSAIIAKCLASNCYAFVAKNLNEAFEISNRIAPEHFELLIKDAEKHAGKVKNAGAIFVGPWTPEALGDYMAGPNHVLPTGGAARFQSPLGVYDFVKRTSLLNFTRKGFEALARDVVALAEEEGLGAHANAVRLRMESK
ncbi:MAG: histidinol dehydrogenase [Nitrospinae bacterium]|nr:histidinol dehydrogenase [Nitrospinota bacterium]